MKVNEKTLRWLFLAIITVSFIVNYAAIFDKKLDVNGDNYMYYLLAHSLSTGQGYVSDIGPEPAPHTHFPPGYPVFLSLFLRIFPNNIVALKLLNGLLFLASLFLLSGSSGRRRGNMASGTPWPPVSCVPSRPTCCAGQPS